MSEQAPVYVNDDLFLGRVEEQKQFRAALSETLAPPRGETLPYVMLLYGGGGMGKTTLARRFRDIAMQEAPFEGRLEALWIDWETERRLEVALQVGREFISAETVFDIIHKAAVRTDPTWGRYFNQYQKMVQQRAKVEKQAAELLSRGDENDELTRTLRGATTSALAKVIRWQVPIGDTGEKLTQLFLEAGVTVAANQAVRVQQMMQTRLQARLKTEQYELFLNPHEQLARAVAEGLQAIARRKPLFLCLDTYEIVDRADDWLRVAIKAVGPKVLWVIAGRHDLARSRPFGPAYFRGYTETFSRRLLAYDMRQLALADLQAYFADAVRERPLNDEAAAALSQATRGIPLAISVAAELWQRGVALEEIVGDITAATPHQEIVSQMTGRYLLHVVTDGDREALYALALAQGDLEVLRAMLQAEGEAAAAFDLSNLLSRLRRDYAAVHADEARLHDEPAAFLTAHLRHEERRTSPAIQRFNERAAAALRARLAQMEAELPLLEERAEDEDWVKATLDLARTLFWLDEQQAWQWLTPRFVEGLAYGRELRQGLVQVAAAWRDSLSRRGQNRLKKLQAAAGTPEVTAEMLDELERLARLGWLAGDGATERSAIMAWQWGQLRYSQKKYQEALRFYDKAEMHLSEHGEQLQRHLGEALYDLAGEFLWPEQQGDAIYSAEAECILPKVVRWLPENQGAWYRLGAIMTKAGKRDEAIAAYQRAIELDPNYAYPHNGLGTVYSDLGRTDEAIAAYQRAIELDPKLAYPHNGLGNVYRALGRSDEAIAAYQRAIALDPNDAYPHNGLGNVYSDLGRSDEAIAAHQRAIELDSNYAYPHHGLGNVYRDLGRTDEAIAAYLKAIKLDPNNAPTYTSLAACYRKLGQQVEYEAQLETARALIANEIEYNRACFEAVGGDIEAALALLKLALEKKQVSLGWAQRDPDFDFIRDDPRFQALVSASTSDRG